MPEDNEQTMTKIDSKYRLIILAAERSKQLIRGAKPRVEMSAGKHKATRIALEEMKSGKIGFHVN
ncbi:MAG: DNA-directed RNA polymerase subunit omega [Pyrinomonadaceae bacterium]